MRKFHSVAALCGDGLGPELQELFDRLAVDPNSELFVRHDGMLQSGPDPKSEAAPVERTSNNMKQYIPQEFFHQVDRPKFLRDHAQHDAAPRSG